jgi:C-terminal processing protease CtpA/Prc
MLAAALVVAGCGGPTAAPPSPLPGAETPVDQQAPSGTPLPAATPSGPVALTGLFTYSDATLTTYYAAPAVALVDLYGFAVRDPAWVIPVESQVLGHLSLNSARQLGEYHLLLPAQPAGTAVDVNHDGATGEGVQVFAVAYLPNLSGGPFAEGDDQQLGWPTDLASVHIRSGDNEITGGKLVVWAPGAGRPFPTGFGADGRLFTADDPLGTLPAGYSLVDLDRAPFAVSQEHEGNLPLYEASGAAVTNLAGLGYSAAFRALFKQVAAQWAFNGHTEPPVDWTSIYTEIAPQVAQAEADGDALAFFKALQTFSFRLPDGYTALDGGEVGLQDYLRLTNGGYGLAVRELDDGRVLITYVLANGPAAQAGLAVGQQVLAFNDQPIDAALAAVEPYGGPFSTDAARRYQQARYLLRAVAGTTATLTVAAPDGAPQTVPLTAIEERASFAVTSILAGSDRTALPVEARRLPNGLGYVRVSAKADDLALALRLFERALATFRSGTPVGGLIIDLRSAQRDGGRPLGLAGYFTNQPIDLGRLEYYDPVLGAFQSAAARDQVLPNQRQFQFDRLAVLVGPACSQACELEAYSLAQVPGAVVVGMGPTAGIVADDAGGRYTLPAGLSLRVATGRYVLPDGSLFLEGQGVAPTVRVPVDERTALATDDVVLAAAVEALLGGGTSGQ